MNFMLIMKNEQSDLMAIGPVAIESQAAVLRDEIEESSNWTPVGIARILTENPGPRPRRRRAALTGLLTPRAGPMPLAAPVSRAGRAGSMAV